jgi:DeoR family myo-inositol catabolism operon transcriptional repressor
MRNLRLNKMEQYITQNNTVSLTELCEVFNVSLNTVRRDILALIDKGIIEKVHGGVRTILHDELIPFPVRNDANITLKVAIGQKAAELVSDGDIIFIDTGTTTLQMINALKNKDNITVITNNLQFIIQALPYENISIISLPGKLSRKNYSFSGLNQIQFMEYFNVKTCFMAAGGISLSHGITHPSVPEGQFCKYIIEHSNHTVLLVDHTKFDVVSLFTFAKLEILDTIITDYMPSQEYQEAFKANNIQLITTEE